MKKNTFKYYMNEHGDLKVEMTSNAARDVTNYLNGFEACAMITIYEKPVRKLRTAEYLADTFLEDKTDYEKTKSIDFVGDSSMVPGYEVFLDAVKSKIDELLG